jgi:hypothetical protein
MRYTPRTKQKMTSRAKNAAVIPVGRALTTAMYSNVRLHTAVYDF